MNGMGKQRDFYQILEISRSANGDQIRAAYRRMAKRYHPDSAGTADTEAFRRAQDAYETLNDPSRRRAYDEELLRPEYVSRDSRRRPDPSSTSYDRSGRGDTGYGTPDSPVDELNSFFEELFGQRPQGRPGAYAADATEFVVHMSPDEAFNGVEAHLQLDLGGTIIVDIPPGVRDGQELSAVYERGFLSQRLRLLIRIA